MKDQEEKLTVERDLLEYHVSFLEPELVSNIKKSREETIGTKDDSAFEESVNNMFGRKVSLPDKKSKEETSMNEVSNVLDKISEYKRQEERKNREKYNYRHWLELKLR